LTNNRQRRTNRLIIDEQLQLAKEVLIGIRARSELKGSGLLAARHLIEIGARGLQEVRQLLGCSQILGGLVKSLDGRLQLLVKLEPTNEVGKDTWTSN
jgi:hypothetical protein